MEKVICINNFRVKRVPAASTTNNYNLVAATTLKSEIKPI